MLRRTSIILALCVCSNIARADTVTLANGDTLNGEIIRWALDHVVIEHPQLGEVRLSLEELAIETGKPPNPGLFGTTFLRGWNRSIDIGWNGEEGNSTTRNLIVGMDFNYADAFKRWEIKGRYYFDADEDGTSDNYARVDLRRDWRFPGIPWFAFASSRYQYDEFESWEHRGLASAGPGYSLVQGENHKLDTRLGATVTREFGERDDTKWETLFAVDYYWQPAERYSLTLSNQLYTQTQPEFGEIRNLTIAEMKIRLSERPALSMNLGAENEYESEVEGDDEKNDLKYYISLGIDF